MTKRRGNDALTKHHHYDKYDPEIKTRLNTAQRKELEDMALAGLTEYNIRQEEAYNRHFTEENKGS